MHASRFGQCAVVTKLCVNALKRLQGAGALDYSAVDWPRALPFVRYCWRTSNKSHAAFFGSSVVSKSCCMHPEPTGEVITAKFREISRPACEGYGRFERRALRRSSPTASWKASLLLNVRNSFLCMVPRSCEIPLPQVGSQNWWRVWLRPMANAKTFLGLTENTRFESVRTLCSSSS